MPHADVNGQSLYYEDTGGDGPAVIFSHGLFMDHSMFDPQVASLRDRYRCITWDERAHGQTAKTTEPFTYWDSADDLHALLESLGVTRAVLAGMSQGGFLSLRAALRYPEMVRALILIDTQAGQENPEVMPYYKSLLDRWNTDGMDDEMAGIISSLILGQGWEGNAAWEAQWKAMDQDNVNQAFTTLATREDLHDRLAEIDIPAIVIHGEQDMSIAMELAQRLTDGLPQSELTVIPGAGHASNLTHPDAVTPAIESFLAGLAD
jgi:pimeloyl-ACP methyl ester carboxylesterase